MCHNRGARGEKTLPDRPYATGRGELKNINGVSVDDEVHGASGEDVVVGDVEALVGTSVAGYAAHPRAVGPAAVGGDGEVAPRGEVKRAAVEQRYADAVAPCRPAWRVGEIQA